MKLIFTFSLACSILFSCKKNNDDAAPGFNINQLEGYVISGAVIRSTGFTPFAAEFLPGQKVKLGYETFYYDSKDYVIDKDTLKVNDNIKLVIKNKKVTHYYYYSSNPYTPGSSTHDLSFNLYKKPEASQLQGKTFTGTYYNYPDGSVLHNSFYYKFAQNTNTLAAGFTIGMPVRSNPYINIGNVAAFAQPGNDRELMVWHNGRLLAIYFNKEENQYQYALLSPQ
ncbi:hypothetical protein [Niabella drilacis]|uniref:Uncharacterized protein n=1 Tax=Niabella drilacis (strain DSM 25811 / CCM 8410 / CCUG 62505 / LMG 26954 / E90) TaxID=1285928 RepID=A0A1G6QE51_NIADE|nr:hypothetical protein [Niabella drilacis]SDC89957.1 hypothetical protein SAMN04487894_104357 [Niabella drilacis]